MPVKYNNLASTARHIMEYIGNNGNNPKRAAKELGVLNNSIRTRIIAGIYNLPGGDVEPLKGYVVLL